MVRTVLTITFMLVLVYLVLTYYKGFGTAFGAASKSYVDMVRVLQGG